MTKPSPLPPNWTLVLEQIQTTLTQAIHLADTREAALEECALASSRHGPQPAGDPVPGLEKCAQDVGSPLLALDEAFQGEEEHVRQHLAMVTGLSQRLAEWMAGAVG
jgi:hypothetical protein